MCQNKQSFPVKSFHHRCVLIDSYRILLSADTIIVLSNALIVAILPQWAVLSTQPQSCSAVTTLRNFPVLIRINNTSISSPILASCPGTAGAPAAAHAGAAGSRPTTGQGRVRVTFRWKRVSSEQRGWGMVLAHTMPRSQGTRSQVPAGTQTGCRSAAPAWHRATACQFVSGDASEDVI